MRGLSDDERGLMGAFLATLYRQNEMSMKLGLDAMRAALEASNHPERGGVCALVAGTNGKGSVSSTLASIGQASGERVGLFTSPHLVHFAERLRVDGRPVDEVALLALGPGVLDEFGVDAPGRRGLTFFELTTLMAVLHFGRARCGWRVMEVGLGGRLDATNALAPDVSVITSIGLDHREILGDTLALIAREKAGILRPGVPAIIGSRVAVGELEEAAREVGAPAQVLGRDFELVQASDGWRYEDRSGRQVVVEAPPAQHQRDNTAAAVAAALALSPGLSGDTIREGLAATRWPGRLWRLPEACREALEARLCRRVEAEVLLDAAHNPAGARALVSYLRRQYADARLGLVLGMMKDKDVEGVSEALSPLSFEVIATTPVVGHARRAEDPERLRARLGRPEAVAAKTLIEALSTGLEALDGAPRGCLVIAGSIYLLGSLLETLGLPYEALITFDNGAPTLGA